ncbi:MAG: arsenate reductase (glutaredoxin) [Woeseiaceae bacterium]
MLVMYHNPRCSKSRQTLELIRNSGGEPEIVQYLQAMPDANRVLHLANLLGVGVAELLRKGEDEFKNANDLPALDDDAALAAWIAQHPKTLERPIVVDDEQERAIIGRPPENVLALLQK